MDLLASLFLKKSRASHCLKGLAQYVVGNAECGASNSHVALQQKPRWFLEESCSLSSKTLKGPLSLVAVMQHIPGV